MPGYLCSTPACSQFPTTPGCSSQISKPTGDYCPFEQPRCFDPHLTAGYCDTATSVCAIQLRMGADCPTMACSITELKLCYDTKPGEMFCSPGYTCKSITCAGSDGGSDGGGGQDAAADSSPMIDASPAAG